MLFYFNFLIFYLLLCDIFTIYGENNLLLQTKKEQVKLDYKERKEKENDI